MTPQRIQRKREKGWKMPDGAVYVGRPTKWGNPFKFGSESSDGLNRAEAVALYELHIGPFGMFEKEEEDWAEIRDRDLVCWCPLDAPCHADVLLEIANVDVETQQ